MVKRIIDFVWKGKKQRVEISFIPQKNYRRIATASQKNLLTFELKQQRKQGIPSRIVKLKKPFGFKKYGLEVRSPLKRTFKRKIIKRKNTRRSR